MDDLDRIESVYGSVAEYDREQDEEMQDDDLEYFPKDNFEAEYYFYNSDYDYYCENLRDAKHTIKLSSITPSNQLSDKVVLPLYQHYFTTDFRGLPHSEHILSSIEKYYIPSFGWLDKFSYEKERHFEGLSDEDYESSVRKYLVRCVDNTGTVYSYEMDKDTFELMLFRTYDAAFIDYTKECYQKYEEYGYTDYDPSVDKPLLEIAIENNGLADWYHIIAVGQDGLVKEIEDDIEGRNAYRSVVRAFKSLSENYDVRVITPDELREKVYHRVTSVADNQLSPIEKVMSAMHDSPDYFLSENSRTVISRLTKDELEDLVHNMIFALNDMRSSLNKKNEVAESVIKTCAEMLADDYDYDLYHTDENLIVDPNQSSGRK